MAGFLVYLHYTLPFLIDTSETAIARSHSVRESGIEIDNRSFFYICGNYNSIHMYSSVRSRSVPIAIATSVLAQCHLELRTQMAED
ncbi:hypothetical protein [Chamaesiphon polymorphus]|uniref:Uncharacterized protein n=1 Tax=Chamaesiphon polymorphus CCALA 037 TaxID=2107692 RepID=A0A2T1GIL3_9CYAN|nr:hypothetical protein [Chamaesiphon polymorphus]PSB57616.1 hypothetical protein C7B77_07755 [Chamaesiphon polymorphus CCALA 037]